MVSAVCLQVIREWTLVLVYSSFLTFDVGCYCSFNHALAHFPAISIQTSGSYFLAASEYSVDYGAVRVAIFTLGY